jgi:hypothetical protein
MRALGPGSVSSFLKIILDVVFAALCIGAGAAALLSLAAMVVVANPGLLDAAAAANLKTQGLSGPSLVIGLAVASVYMALVLIIVGRLRRIFATLTAGDPFQPENIRRLRVIGVVLAVLEVGRYPLAALYAWLAPGEAAAHAPLNPTAWFAVLVIFVLAEVFREGARLRREAELTI